MVLPETIGQKHCANNILYLLPLSEQSYFAAITQCLYNLGLELLHNLGLMSKLSATKYKHCASCK